MRKFIIVIACILTFCSCEELFTIGSGPAGGKYDRVFIYYASANNNLSYNLREDLADFEKAGLPSRNSPEAAVLFCHFTKSSNSDGRPVVIRLTAEGRDTLGFFPYGTRDTDVDVIGTALEFIAKKLPSDHYSMLVTSHGTGWLPVGYSTKDEPYEPFFSSKSICHEDMVGQESTQIDFKDFIGAIPMHLDNLIFDACLMGGVEVAYEFRKKCDIILFSPTEILTQGMIYSKMPQHLFGTPQVDMVGIAKDYFEYYDGQAGTQRSATITVVDCRKLEPLASAYGDIVRAHRDRFAVMDPSSVQRYYRSTTDWHWFYDLRDIAVHAGASATELEKMDSALSGAVIYKAATPGFFGSQLTITHYSGLSSYIPDARWTKLNAYYKELEWNKACTLVQ